MWTHGVGWVTWRNQATRSVEGCIMAVYHLEAWPDEPRCEWMVPGTWAEVADD